MSESWKFNKKPGVSITDLIAEATVWRNEDPDADSTEQVSAKVTGLIGRLADALEAVTVPTESDALAKDWYDESERLTDKLMAVREWAHENQSHEIYEATDEQPAECTDECAWCALDQILSAPERLPVPVEPESEGVTK